MFLVWSVTRVYTRTIYIYIRPQSVQVQYSRSCTIISCSCYNDRLVTWTVVFLTAAKFKPLIFPVSGFALSNVADICIFMILCDMLVACIILLYNRIHTEVWKPFVNREPVCALENCQCCGEFCFAGAVISVDVCLSQTLRRDKHKSWYS
jgi:hypothetical protein